jgi:hypothetical protein
MDENNSEICILLTCDPAYNKALSAFGLPLIPGKEDGKIAFSVEDMETATQIKKILPKALELKIWKDGVIL